MDDWGGTDDDLSSGEEQLLRFQYENALPLRAAHLGFDMDRFVHLDDAGKHLVETAIDTIHDCMVALIDQDLTSARARMLQVEAKAAKMMIDTVLEALERGRMAALQVADAELEGEDSG